MAIHNWLSRKTLLMCLFSQIYNVWCNKNRTKGSSKTLLCLVRFLLHQTLTISLLLPSFQDAKKDRKLWFASISIVFLMCFLCYGCNFFVFSMYFIRAIFFKAYWFNRNHRHGTYSDNLQLENLPIIRLFYI